MKQQSLTKPQHIHCRQCGHVMNSLSKSDKNQLLKTLTRVAINYRVGSLTELRAPKETQRIKRNSFPVCFMKKNFCYSLNM